MESVFKPLQWNESKSWSFQYSHVSTVDANIFCLRSSQEEALYQDSAPNSKYRETPTGFWGIVSNIMREWPHDIKSTVPYPNELPYPAVLESLSCGHLLLPGLRRHKCLSCEEQPPWGLYPGVHRNRWYGQARRTSCAAGRWCPPWPGEIHYSDVIWVSWRPKSISVRRFVQWLMLADIKKKIKGPHHWPFFRLIHQWALDSKGPVMRKAYPWHDVLCTSW